MAREGVPLNVVQRQLGHANLGITSVYLQGIDNSEIIETVGARAAPTLPASAGLRSRSSREAERRHGSVGSCWQANAAARWSVRPPEPALLGSMERSSAS